MAFIDITPTWSAILPALLKLRDSSNTEARTLAETELVRMARLADERIALLKVDDHHV